MPDDSDLERRTAELELKFMEQQRLLEELSEALFTQDRVVAGLSRGLERLAQKVGAAPGLVDADGDDKPPHY